MKVSDDPSREEFSSDRTAEGTGSSRREVESTRDLLEQAQRGDRSSLERLMARYLPRFRRWASGRLPKAARDLVDTEDLVQETLLQTIRNLEHLEDRGEGAFQAYVRASLKNRIRDQVRRVERRSPNDTLPEALFAEGTSPIEAIVGKETLERYEAAMERLSDGEREAVIGRVELGMSYKELAEALDKPSADAARMAVSRALVRLAEEMGR